MDDLIPAFIFVVCVVAIIGGVTQQIVSKVIDYKKSQRLHDANNSGADVNQIADRTDYLEERVRVLERIATDRGADLAQEIEDLRERNEYLNGERTS